MSVAPSVASTSILGSVLALVMVLLLIVALAWVLRRLQFSSMGRTGPIRIIASTALGLKERLVLVEIGEQQLLLGVTTSEISLLQRLETPIDVEPVPTAFRSTLDRYLRVGGA
jgi:flagellar protein FliO/FliZ